jgi:predicted ferric reductase
MSDANDKQLTVVKVDRENHDTTSLYFAGPDMEKFKNRSAGQFASIRIYRDGAWSEPHPFTLSCSPEDETLRMTIKKSGDFTTVVPEIEPGTPIQCVGPFGQFCRGIDSKSNIVMIAGGVGITPFLSVLRHFVEIKAQNRVTLFWANKTFADAFAAKELEELTRILSLNVVHAFSRMTAEQAPPPPIFHDDRPGTIVHEFGRLDQQLLMKYLPSKDAAFYLCGPPSMQQAILSELEQCGVNALQVEKEAFVFSKPAP